MIEEVPTIDLSRSREENVIAMDAALRKFGFFYVSNHGVDLDLIQEQFEMSADLFGLPKEVKEKEMSPWDSDLDIGYVGSGTQVLEQGLGAESNSVQEAPDTKEQFMMTNNKILTDQSSKTNPNDIFEGSQNFTVPLPNHHRVSRAYASAVYRLNLVLNELLFDAMGLSEDERTTLGSEPFTVLKQMKYAGEPSDPAKGKFGAGAHTDWGSFTVLATDMTPGLQVHMFDRWLPIQPKPGCLIINSGDQIAQLTNNVYRSSLHRVVTTSRKPRFSTAFFTYFNLYAKVGPLPPFITKDNPPQYPLDRTTLQYFHFKLKESFNVEQ